MFESYPQMVLSIFIMQSLQLKEWFNIGSGIISTFSVIYGYSELLAILSHDNNPNYPFAKTIWGMLAILIDTLLRALSMAYLMTFFKVLDTIALEITIATLPSHTSPPPPPTYNWSSQSKFEKKAL